MHFERRVSCLLLAGALAGCGPSAEKVRQAELAAQREREHAEQAGKRAKELQEGLKSLSEMAVADLRASLEKAQAQLKGAKALASVKGDLDRLAASVESLQKIQTSAKEARTADILPPAIEGFLATEAILTERSAKGDEAVSALVELLKRDSSATEMDKLNREMTINNAMMQLAKGPFQLFAASIGLLAKNGPPETRKATFDAVAAAIPRARFGRLLLEQALRSCHEQEEDEATKSGFATTMARLEVPLTPPAPKATPSAAAASPGAAGDGGR